LPVIEATIAFLATDWTAGTDARRELAVRAFTVIAASRGARFLQSTPRTPSNRASKSKAGNSASTTKMRSAVRRRTLHRAMSAAEPENRTWPFSTVHRSMPRPDSSSATSDSSPKEAVASSSCPIMFSCE
jgi:hypothetical protein